MLPSCGCRCDCLLSVALLLITAAQYGSAQSCSDDKIDLVFVLDDSGSVGWQNFNRMKNFVKDVTDAFTIGSLNTLVGVYTFTYRSSDYVPLGSVVTRDDLAKAISQVPYRPGYSNILLALEELSSRIFATDPSREEARRFVILITDETAVLDSGRIDRQAGALSSRGVVTIAVGVGAGVDKVNLQRLVTPPHEDNLHLLPVFDDLSALSLLLIDKLCVASFTPVGGPGGCGTIPHSRKYRVVEQSFEGCASRTGDTANVTCLFENAYMIGDPMLTCLADGTWSHEIYCEELDIKRESSRLTRRLLRDALMRVKDPVVGMCDALFTVAPDAVCVWTGDDKVDVQGGNGLVFHLPRMAKTGYLFN